MCKKMSLQPQIFFFYLLITVEPLSYCTISNTSDLFSLATLPCHKHTFPLYINSLSKPKTEQASFPGVPFEGGF